MDDGRRRTFSHWMSYATAGETSFIPGVRIAAIAGHLEISHGNRFEGRDVRFGCFFRGAAGRYCRVVMICSFSFRLLDTGFVK